MQDKNQSHNPNLTGVILILMFVLVVGILTNNAHYNLAMESVDESGESVALVVESPTGPQPTDAPLDTPTTAPTSEPTSEPTAVPTNTPTPAPTQTLEPEPETGDTATSDEASASTTDYDPAVVEHGAQMFTMCAACHGADAKGVPNLGKDLVNSEFVHGSTDEELMQFIVTGRPIWDPLNTTGIDMPPKGGNPALTNDDIMAIIAYIRSLSAQ